MLLFRTDAHSTKGISVNMPPSTMIAVENLSFGYGKDIVWDGIGFSLDKGKVAFLVGSNGAGKSTLLRCLAGWLPTRSGTVALCGQSLHGKNRELQGKVAFVPDTPSFYDDLTSQEHIDFVLKANKQHHRLADAALLMEDFGLSSHKDQFPSSYSRGMRGKLALVIAFCLKPSLYLLDEPYGPLDHRSALILSEKIRTAVAEGASAIISCHQTIPELEPDTVFRFEENVLHVDDALPFTKRSATAFPYATSGSPYGENV